MSSKKSFFTTFVAKLKALSGKLMPSPKITVEADRTELNARLERLERNYIILLKRVLEIDGVQLITKHSNFTTKVMNTPSDEFQQGLNEPEPTIH